MFTWFEKKTEEIPTCAHIWEVKEKQILESECMKLVKMSNGITLNSMPREFYLETILVHSFCTLCKTEKVEKL